MRSAAPLVVTMVACLTGCGKISFGDDLLPTPDAGPTDAEPGPDVPPIDAGVVDVGVDTGVEIPDAGEDCIPVTVPPMPMDWPFEASRGAYEGLFWTWAEQQEFRCSTSACHGEANPPRIPTVQNLQEQYPRGIEELWDYMRNRSQEPGGRLWRHSPTYPGGAEIPEYTPEQMQFFRDLVQRAYACEVAPALARQDAGPACGPEDPPPPPEDAGVDEDGGGLDGGVVDGGGPGPSDAGARSPCYCDAPDVGPLNTEFCAP